VIKVYELPTNRKPLLSEMRCKLMNDIAILRDEMGLIEKYPLSCRHQWQGWSATVSTKAFERWKRLLEWREKGGGK
jgi:hypothetical protein